MRVCGRIRDSRARIGHRFWVFRSLDPQDVSEGVSESWRPQRVTEEIHRGIHDDEQKLKISEPMEGCAATTFAKAHGVDENRRWTVTTEERYKHDHKHLCNFLFPLCRCLTLRRRLRRVPGHLFVFHVVIGDCYRFVSTSFEGTQH